MIQILYFLVNLLIQLKKKNYDFKDVVFLDELKLYSIKYNNATAFNLFIKKKKELEEQYQEQVLAFGFILFFIYALITNFNYLLLIGIKSNNDLFYGVILLLIIYSIYISLFVPINRNYIYDKELKNIIKDER